MVQVNKLLAQVSLPISGFSKGFYQTAGTDPAGRMATLISNIVTALTIFGGLAFLLWFVVGGLSWTMSGGNQEQLNKAKSQMSTAIAGLVVLILATTIVWILGKVTGLDILNLEDLVKRVKPVVD